MVMDGEVDPMTDYFIQTTMPTDFQTPGWVCKKMVSMIGGCRNKSILEPTPGEGNLVDEIKRYYNNVTAPNDFWKLSSMIEFDCIVANPPFSPMEMGYRMLDRFMDITDHIICLLPWLSLINSEGRTQRILSYGLKMVSHLPRHAFPGSRVQTCVLEMKRGWKEDTILKFWKPGDGQMTILDF